MLTRCLHQPALGAHGRALGPEPAARWRKAPGRARAASKLRPRLCRQPAVLTRRDAPDAAPTAQGKRSGCRVPLADPTLGALGHLHPPPRFPPLPAARGHLGIVHVPRGKSSQRQESSEPARVPRRQAGACTQRRTRTQTRTDSGTHAGGKDGPRECGSIPGAPLSGRQRSGPVRSCFLEILGVRERDPPAAERQVPERARRGFPAAWALRRAGWVEASAPYTSLWLSFLSLSFPLSFPLLSLLPRPSPSFLFSPSLRLSLPRHFPFRSPFLRSRFHFRKTFSSRFLFSCAFSPGVACWARLLRAPEGRRGRVCRHRAVGRHGRRGQQSAALTSPPFPSVRVSAAADCQGAVSRRREGLSGGSRGRLALGPAQPGFPRSPGSGHFCGEKDAPGCQTVPNSCTRSRAPRGLPDRAPRGSCQEPLRAPGRALGALCDPESQLLPPRASPLLPHAPFPSPSRDLGGALEGAAGSF